jgi:mRNA-degrading endonuclease toxin of MazEF toxin-antitoxin module
VKFGGAILVKTSETSKTVKAIIFMRPILVLKKYNRNICLVVPLSSQIKENKYYFTLKIKQKSQSFLVSQLRTLDTKRFVKKMSQLTLQEFTEVKDYIQKMTF